MFKQAGITTLELLLSLTIVSSVSAFTIAMSEEVEEALVQQQEERLDIKILREKLKHVAKVEKAEI